MGTWGSVQALLDPTVTFWNSRQLGGCYGGELGEEDASSREVVELKAASGSKP